MSDILFYLTGAIVTWPAAVKVNRLNEYFTWWFAVICFVVMAANIFFILEFLYAFLGLMIECMHKYLEVKNC